MRKQVLPIVPHMFTYGTLFCGIASIVLSVEGHLLWAGTFILIGMLTDTLDGMLARTWRTASQLGVQLDSLADSVCFTVGAPIFAYQYLRLQQVSSLLSLLIILPVPAAGALRLARFNLLPIKTGREDHTVGLTVWSAGPILVLAGLSGLHYSASLLPLPAMILLPSLLALLMVSRVRFATFGSITRRKKTTAVLLGVSTLLSVRFSPQLIFLGLMLSYVGEGVARAGYGLANR